MPILRDVSGPGAAWCWFADPRALYRATPDGPGQGRIITGWVDMEARVIAAGIEDLDDGNYLVREYILSDRSTVSADDVTFDDHANPSFMVRGDKVVAFWSGHSGRQMNYRIGLQPCDVHGFAAPLVAASAPAGSYGITYPNVWQLGDGKTYVLYRGPNFQPHIVRSDFVSDPSHWTEPKHLINVGLDSGGTPHRPYLKAVSGNGGGTLHIAFTDAHPRNHTTSLFHAKYQWANGYWKRSDGANIDTWDTVPFHPTSATRIFDGTTPMGRAWLVDLAVAASTAWNPVALFSVHRSRSDIDYRLARWTGTAWQVETIDHAGPSIEVGGEEHYVAGGALDPADPDNRMWLSVPRGPVHDVAEYRRVGGSWQRVGWLDEERSRRQRVRPVAVRDDPQSRLLVMHGTYRRFVDFRDTRIELALPLG